MAELLAAAAAAAGATGVAARARRGPASRTPAASLLVSTTSPSFLPVPAREQSASHATEAPPVHAAGPFRPRGGGGRPFFGVPAIVRRSAHYEHMFVMLRTRSAGRARHTPAVGSRKWHRPKAGDKS